MIRIYTSKQDTLTFTTPIDPQFLESIVGEKGLKYGDKESKSLPSVTPTTKTRDAYIEQVVYAVGDQPIAVIREAKLETLDKLPHPFDHATTTQTTDTSITEPANPNPCKARAKDTPPRTRTRTPKTTGVKLKRDSKARNRKVRDVRSGPRNKPKQRRGSH